MSSYISSFKKNNLGFIGKSFGVCLLLFMIYNLFILLNPPHITAFDNQYKNNIAIAQRYLYDYTSVSTVIVGSSMAALLKNEALLDNQVYNLGLRGSGSMSGLHLIEKNFNKPEYAIIEINSILSSVDDEFIVQLLSPVTFHMKKIFPCLRAEYQPINVFINTLLNISNKNLSFIKFDKHRFQKAFAIKKRKYSNSPNINMVSNRINDLQEITHRLALYGVKAVFFEMPVHEDLKTSKFMKTIRTELVKSFPKDKYVWIDNLSISTHDTSDGIHLTTKAAKIVTAQLLENLKTYR